MNLCHEIKKRDYENTENGLIVVPRIGNGKLHERFSG